MRQGSKGKKPGKGPKRPVARRPQKPPRAKVQAKQPVAKNAPKPNGFKDHESEQRLAEAVEREKAIGEILRVMSISPGDVQPVLEAVAERAAQLCDAPYANVWIREGDTLRPSAFSRLPQPANLSSLPLTRGSVNGRAVLDRKIVHHADIVPFLDTEYPDGRQNMQRVGTRAHLAVPLLREGEACGTVTVFRREPRPFSPEQIALVETFARQAVIAIDNARLFHETKEALARQTATADILRAISSSPTDVQPVFDTIVATAKRLMNGYSSLVTLRRDDALHLAALSATTKAGDEALKRRFPVPLDSSSSRILVNAVRSGLPAMRIDTEADADVSPQERQMARTRGYRSALAVPIMRAGEAIGTISVTRTVPGSFSAHEIELLQTFAAQAVIAIENVRLFNETKETLERQTATAEILKVISESPTDVQPVFDAIVRSAKRVFGALTAVATRVVGDSLHLAAFSATGPDGDDALKRMYPIPIIPGTLVGEAASTGQIVAVSDVLTDPRARPAMREVAQARGFRSILLAPMLREGVVIGTINISRAEAGGFSDHQQALIKTFADQAVIAIENVRLFNETKEALERQTATSEVLEAISGAQADASPVFETIARNAHRLTGAVVCNVLRYDGSLLDIAASYGFSPEDDQQQRRKYPVKPGDASVLSGRVILSGKVERIDDALRDPLYDQNHAAAHHARRILGVPMLRDGAVLGVIVVAWREPGPTPVALIDLLKTFADQAVIAIENVRLFTELEGRNHDLTATSEILRVISISPTNVQPVFDAIVKNAVQLCEARYGAVFRLDRGLVHLAAHHNISETLLAQWFHTSYPMAPNRGHASGRAILGGSTVQVPDILADKDYLGEGMKTAGFRSLLGVPLLHRGQAVGAIVIYRMEPGQFADKHVELLKTFADQAVIAIENVRLFAELEARTSELTRSVGELKALGEVGQAVSSTLDLETVLSTIVSRAVQLAGMDGGSIWEYDEAREQFYVRATDRLPDELAEVHRATPIRKGEGALGRLAMTGEPVEIPDIATEPGYPNQLREILIRSGYRSVLAVPLLREDHLLGALGVNRTMPGEFAPEVIALLKTFATQSALAIQNARLYREIEVKSKELEAASRHKSEFLANMSHELRTPLNAIIGFSEVLSERMFGEINEKQAEYLGDILHSGQHLLSLINDILDLSKIEAGRMELELSDFDLPGTIENTLTLVRERAVRRGIMLGRTVDESLGTIRADERKVKQVLLNLLSNALKFTPEGGKIEVRAAMDDGVAEVSVTDTGVGIAPEDQDTVFEEFRQVGTASKKVEGTGLGLAISRKFIELHGGKIWVKSQVGSGSTFAFTLPLR